MEIIQTGYCSISGSVSMYKLKYAIFIEEKLLYFVAKISFNGIPLVEVIQSDLR